MAYSGTAQGAIGLVTVSQLPFAETAALVTSGDPRLYRYNNNIYWWDGSSNSLIGGGIAIAGEVSTYADLPAAADHADEYYVVKTTTGVFLLGTKKEAGVYRSDGAAWSRLGDWFASDQGMADGKYFASDAFRARDTDGLTLADKDGVAGGKVNDGGLLDIYTPAGTFNGAILTNTETDTRKALQLLDDLLDGTVGKPVTLSDDFSVGAGKTITVGALTKPYSIIASDYWQITADAAASERNYIFSIDPTDGSLSLATNSELTYWLSNGDFYPPNVFAFDGSSSSPAFTFQSDTDLGVYRSGDNTLGIAAGGGVNVADFGSSISLRRSTNIFNALTVYRNLSDSSSSVVRTVGQVVDSSNTTAVSASLLNSPSINPGTGTWSFTPISLASNRCGVVNSSALSAPATFVGVSEFYANTDFSTAITSGGSLAVTNLYGYYYQDLSALGANVSVANQYGLYIEEPSRGGTLNIGLHNSGITEFASYVHFSETLTKPAARTGYGQMYAKSDGELYYLDSANIEHTLTKTLNFKSAFFRSPNATGSFYVFGFYDAPATDVTLTNASLTQTYGSSTNSYAAHAFIVAGGAGTVDAGQVGLRVTGTSITDGGVRTATDSEVLTDDITSLTLDGYLETAKKWLGTVTFELYTVTGTPTTYSLDFNYGFAKYDDNGNRDFTITDFEVEGKSGSSDTGFNIELLKHSLTGWSYSAAAFVPGDGVICDMNTDHGAESDITNGEPFAYKRAELSTAINGSGSEGFIVRFTCGSPGSVDYADIDVGMTYDV